jgi:RNA polymerase sigma-70 factor, ECF subfamily
MRPFQLDRFHSGDEQVYADVVASVQSAVRREIRRFVGTDRDSEDDLYSATCERMFDRRRDFRGEGPVEAWVLRLCTRMCIDQRRAARRVASRTRPLDIVPEVATDSRSDDERVRDAQQLESRLEAVSDAVVSLPPRMRAMALSCWYFGHRPAHIAREFGVTAPTVWTTLSKARTILRRRLETLVQSPSAIPPRLRT